MTTENITEYTLRQECESLAKSIIDEYEGDRTDIDALREYAQERAHEDADNHQWVIYTYKARQVASIAPDGAEEYLEEIYEKPFNGCDTFGDVCTRLAYAALYTGVMEALETLIEEIENATPPSYLYFINLDERGEFFADVRAESDNGATVFEIHGYDDFDDLGMVDKRDLNGLRDHLIDLAIIPQNATLERGN